MDNECRHEFKIRPGVKPWIFATCAKCGLKRPLRQSYSLMVSVLSLFGLLPYLHLKESGMGSTAVYLITIASYLAFGAVLILLFMLYLRSLRPKHLDKYFEVGPAE